ncbi:hypothetical protein [Rahnella sp. ChDrAdgB13]|uniref:hypothetical protein n=1 Tax=Rahnella sp. ChDrAdgB13 TaxID=1850581 RepID=UPI001AD87474|nr:hypothetical protein [Rahnella sp. ChDrAdgB13]
MSTENNEIIMEQILACQAAWSSLLMALAATNSVDLSILEKKIKDAQLLFVEKKSLTAAEALSPCLNAVHLLKDHAEK